MTNSTQIPIPRQALERALAFISKEETRYYLCGVHIVCTGERILIKATNGHIAYAFGQAVEAGETPEPFDVIVPEADIKKALKDFNKYVHSIPFQAAGEKRIQIGQSIIPTIDGTFPDLRRVLPQETSGECTMGDEPLGFNPEYLTKIAKAFGKQLAFQIYANGASAAIARIGDENELVVIMPFRGAGLLSEPTKHQERLAAIYGAPTQDESKPKNQEQAA